MKGASRYDFRFVVDNANLDERQVARIEAAIAEAGLRAIGGLDLGPGLVVVEPQGIWDKIRWRGRYARVAQLADPSMQEIAQEGKSFR